LSLPEFSLWEVHPILYPILHPILHPILKTNPFIHPIPTIHPKIPHPHFLSSAHLNLNFYFFLNFFLIRLYSWHPYFIRGTFFMHSPLFVHPILVSDRCLIQPDPLACAHRCGSLGESKLETKNDTQTPRGARGTCGLSHARP
jgi:hypothetical protein